MGATTLHVDVHLVTAQHLRNELVGNLQDRDRVQELLKQFESSNTMDVLQAYLAEPAVTPGKKLDLSSREQRGPFIISMCKAFIAFADHYYRAAQGKRGCRDLIIGIADDNRWFEDAHRATVVSMLLQQLEMMRSGWDTLEDLQHAEKRYNLLVSLSRQVARVLLGLIVPMPTTKK